MLPLPGAGAFSHARLWHKSQHLIKNRESVRKSKIREQSHKANRGVVCRCSILMDRKDLKNIRISALEATIHNTHFALLMALTLVDAL